MLEFEIAALYYFVAGILNLPAYFDAVPEDMEIPCVFYPSPHQKSGDFSTNTYATTFTLYAKVMDIDNVSAGGKCSQIVHAISGNRYKVPLVDEKGKRTGKNFRIDSMEATKADEGVWQIEISWKRYTRFNEKSATLAREFYFNGTPIAEQIEGGQNAE